NVSHARFDSAICAQPRKRRISKIAAARRSSNMSLGRLPSLDRGLRLEHRKHLLGKELQASLGDLVGRAAEAEGDVQLEIANDLSTLFEAAQDFIRRAPARRLHETVYRALEAALAGDLRLLLVGIVALHRLEMIAQDFVVVEVAFDEFPLVPPRFFLGLGEV